MKWFLLQKRRVHVGRGRGSGAQPRRAAAHRAEVKAAGRVKLKAAIA